MNHIQEWRRPVGRLGVHPAYTLLDFGRIEGATGQWQRTTLLLAQSDFQTLRHL